MRSPAVRKVRRPTARSRTLLSSSTSGDALRLGQGEELAVESRRRDRHLAGHHHVADWQRRFVLDRLGDGVLVEIAQLVVGAEYLEGALPLGRLVDGRAGESNDGCVGDGRHQVGAQVLGHRTVRLVDEHVDVVTSVGILLQPFELVDHGQDQPALVGSEQLPELGLGTRTPDRNVLLLHLAQQPLDPALELSFQFHPVHHHDHCRRAELLLSFQDQARCGEQREGLAGALRMPDESPLLRRLQAALDDAVDCAALVLAQHAFPGLSVFDVKEDPVAQRAQKIGRLEERLDGESIARLRMFLPACHEAARGIPGNAVPVIEEMRDVEELS